MNAMLTDKDLQAIGGLIDRKIDPFRLDMKNEFRFVHAEISRLDGKIDGVEQRLGSKIDDVMKHVDGFAKNQEKFDAELAAHQVALDRLKPSPTNA